MAGEARLNVFLVDLWDWSEEWPQSKTILHFLSYPLILDNISFVGDSRYSLRNAFVGRGV